MPTFGSGYKVETAGFGITIVALRRTWIETKEAAKIALDVAGGILYKNVRKRMSYTDHTLADLARMGHPYARRHGTIRIHKKEPWIVHKQSGTLLSAMRGWMHEDGLGLHYDIWVDLNTAFHGKYVIEGTKVMLPRDVIWMAVNEAYLNKKMMMAIVRKLGKEMRAKCGIRFETTGGGVTSGQPGAALGVGG